MRIVSALRLIRENLTDDLLKPKYRKRLNRKPTSGHCYVATEALYYLLSERQRKIFRPHYLKVMGDTHWFLKAETKNGVTEMIDPTYDQFERFPNYSLGKRGAFLTKKPSKRTMILLKRIENGRKPNTKNT